MPPCKIECRSPKTLSFAIRFANSSARIVWSHPITPSRAQPSMRTDGLIQPAPAECPNDSAITAVCSIWNSKAAFQSVCPLSVSRIPPNKPAPESSPNAITHYTCSQNSARITNSPSEILMEFAHSMPAPQHTNPDATESKLPAKPNHWFCRMAYDTIAKPLTIPRSWGECPTSFEAVPMHSLCQI